MPARDVAFSLGARSVRIEHGDFECQFVAARGFVVRPWACRRDGPGRVRRRRGRPTGRQRRSPQPPTEQLPSRPDPTGDNVRRLDPRTRSLFTNLRDLDAIEMRGYALMELQKHERALDDFRFLRRMSPDDYLPAMAMGVIYTRQGRLEEGEQQFPLPGGQDRSGHVPGGCGRGQFATRQKPGAAAGRRVSEREPDPRASRWSSRATGSSRPTRTRAPPRRPRS